MKEYTFETKSGRDVTVINPSFESDEYQLSISRWAVSEDEYNRVLNEWKADQRSEQPSNNDAELVAKCLYGWCRYSLAHDVALTYEEFVKAVGDLTIDFDIFEKVKAEVHRRGWEKLRVEPKAEEPKSPDIQVGDWVRGEKTGIVYRVARADSILTIASIEKLEPTAIDKLGWWIIRDELSLVIINDHLDEDYPFGTIESDGGVDWLRSDTEGIFIADVTDEQLLNYLKTGEVPQCPINVRP